MKTLFKYVLDAASWGTICKQDTLDEGVNRYLKAGWVPVREILCSRGVMFLLRKDFESDEDYDKEVKTKPTEYENISGAIKAM